MNSARNAAVGVLGLIVFVRAFPASAQTPIVTLDACLPTDGETNAVATASGPRDDCAYFWTIGGGTIIEGQGTPYLVFTWVPPAHDITVSAEAFGPSGCSGTGTATARTGLVASASGDATICRGYSTPLIGSGGTSCVWFPPEGLDDPNSCTPMATPNRSLTYHLEVADETGCPSTNVARVSITLPFDPPDRVSVDHSLPAETPGLTASASWGSCWFRWTIEGGTITSSPIGRSVTFTSGPPGTRVALKALVSRTSECPFPVALYGRAQVDFADVPPESFFHEDVAEIGRRGITAGCGAGRFCPDDPVRRDQTAVLLMKAAHGATCTPPTCAGRFADVPCSSPFAAWVEMLANDGVTAGCGGGNFCPDRHVTRAQMAALLLKSVHGTDFTPPPCTSVFADVPCPGPFADWIEAAHFEGLVAPCQADPLLFCPDYSVTRAWMAKFLAGAFDGSGN